jgi:arylsulfatase A-like enzyme
LSLFFVVASTISVASGTRAAAYKKTDKPNIVLIFIDDLGIGDVGPFGNTTIKTPNLDRLASEGTKFRSFYATPVCSMSRAALMTGCYNARVSMPGVLFPNTHVGLNPDETTVAEVLKGQGYATVCIGKWHLGHREPFLPIHQGFDAYFGIPYSNDMTIDPVNAKFAKDCVFREGMTEEKARAGAIKNTVPLMRGGEVVEYPADQSTLTKRYTEEAVRFIRDNQAGPFFVYLPHSMVHVPLYASEQFKGKSEAGLFGDTVEEVDWSVGQIMATLKELKLDDNTLVLFTSDNGAATGSALPFRGKKGSSYEGGVREPCIMRWTGRIPAGTECMQIAGNVDVLPTFAKLAGAPIGNDNKLKGRTLDGRDLTPLMFDPKAGPARTTHLYYSGTKLLAYRRGDWKLFPTAPPQGRGKNAVKPKDPGPELYNLAEDPAETTNLAKQKPELVAELKAEFDSREAEIGSQKRPLGTLPEGT